MKSILVSFIFICSALFAHAQDKGDLSFSLGFNECNYKMKDVEEYLADPTFFDPMLYSDMSFSDIMQGKMYDLELTYQFFKYVDFGLHLNYQGSELTRSFFYQHYPDPITYPDSIQFTYAGFNLVETRSISSGLTANVLLNEVFHFEDYESKILKRITLESGVKFLVGMSSMRDQRITTSPTTAEGVRYNLTATNFNGRAELKIGYRFEKDLFTEIGIKLGYQVHLTAPLENLNRDNLSSPSHNEFRLDFGGFYYGLFLKLGK
jgi:hypothetical protein